MMDNEKTSMEQIRRGLRADCANCFGLCCTALCFAKTDGFPVDKPAGEPCPKLQMNFQCRVYGELTSLGLKGCTGYDCFGAGQRVAQETYGGRDWRRKPESKEQMFKAFLAMQDLHEILWYLCEAQSLLEGAKEQDEAARLLLMLETLGKMEPRQLAGMELDVYRDKANVYIKKAGEAAQSRAPGNLNLYPLLKKTPKRRLNLMGASLQKAKLIGADLRGAYLIAADLRGADLGWADMLGADTRDADIRGADLSKSIFLTQMQMNAAKGDAQTKLPGWILRPRHWEK